ncbi:hypothetical protein MMC14_008745 [Varicellaria rhodocarpa]|nr:hypothetical protein [Varicellaria rhodocarpa]
MLYSVITFSLLVSLIRGYAGPGSCSGACNTHDPAVIQRSYDGVYFRFTTGNDISVAKASSLSGPWTNQGSVLPKGSSINLAGNKDLWAPDVHLIGSTYYLYYAVSTFGSQSSAIGLATSSSLDVGTWTDLGATGVASASGKPYNAIDPNLISVGSNYYLTFGSFWDDIYQAPMTSPPTRSVGAAPSNLVYNSTGTHAIEGSYLFAYSGYYYLFFSSGICCNYNTAKPATGSEYKIMLDSNGKSCLSGGGTVVLASHDNIYGPGGQGVFTDSKLGPVLYYHYANTNIGISDSQYQFGWNALTWSDGWPTV